VPGIIMMDGLYLAFLCLAFYNTGCMTTLQLQHYGIYAFAGREGFAAYMRANNRAALMPTIVPALLLLMAAAALVFVRPPYLRFPEAVAALLMNVAALASTVTWQRPIQAQMAETGYDAQAIHRLNQTNWIRTVAYGVNAIVALMPLVRILAGRH
jgi:hypothetical protein